MKRPMRVYTISLESMDGVIKSLEWHHYASRDVLVANLINTLSLHLRDDDMIFRVDKYYDKENNETYQKYKAEQIAKAKARYA